MQQCPKAHLSVTFSKSKNGNTVATVRILSRREIKWRRVSGDADKKEMFRRAIQVGKKYCQGPVAYQLPLL